MGTNAERVDEAHGPARRRIGMMQDAGLSLEEIAGVIDAAHVKDWKAIGRRRLTMLDAEGALLCRYDQPATGAGADKRHVHSARTMTAGRAA